jgi:hypothetical protein
VVLLETPLEEVAMNYQKLDTALAIALNNVHNPEEPSLTVFIHTESAPDAAATTLLESLGISVTSGQNMFSATLSANSISQLSEQSWVKYIKLSQTLRPLDRQ